MINVQKMIIEFKNGGAQIRGNMNINLLNSFVFTVADSYGHEKFADALNEMTDVDDGKYEVTATFEGGEVKIHFEPSLEKKHYLGVCNVVLQAQGVSE